MAASEGDSGSLARPGICSMFIFIILSIWGSCFVNAKLITKLV